MQSISTDHYLVEKIIGIAIDKENRKYYKVEWAASWEKEENLTGCGELIKKFIVEQANEINAELQQQSGNINQENVLQTINEVINQSTQNRQYETNNIKLEVLSTPDGEGIEPSQNESSNNDDGCSKSDDKMEETNNDCSNNLDVERDTKGIHNLKWFNSIDRGAAETSTRNTSVVDTSSKQTTTETNSHTPINRRITKRNSEQHTPSLIPRINDTSKHSKTTYSQSDITILFPPLQNHDCIEEGFLKCNICGNTYETFSNLQLHKKTHTLTKGNTVTKANTVMEDTSTVSQINTVTENNIKLEWSYSLQREITPKILKSFKCVGCEKTFKTSPLLKKHIKTHKGPLKCHQCFQKFTRYHSLNLHVMNVHTNDVSDLLTSQKYESDT